MKKIECKTAAEVTEAIIKQWQNEYPSGISELTVYNEEFKEIPQGDNKPPLKEPIVLYKGWIRKPTRNEMREFMSVQTDPVTYTERILETLWLGGDEELQTNDEAFYAIMPEVQKVIDIKHAEIKKL